MYFSISCPAYVLQEAVKATTFLHSGQVSNVMSKAPSTDLEQTCGPSYSCSEGKSPLPQLMQEIGPA